MDGKEAGQRPVPPGKLLRMRPERVRAREARYARTAVERQAKIARPVRGDIEDNAPKPILQRIPPEALAISAILAATIANAIYLIS